LYTIGSQGVLSTTILTTNPCGTPEVVHHHGLAVLTGQYPSRDVVGPAQRIGQPEGRAEPEHDVGSLHDAD
jgi:hypothetical protein